MTAIAEWCDGFILKDGGKHAGVVFNDGRSKAEKGDYICKSENGKFFVVTAQEMAELYEELRR